MKVRDVCMCVYARVCVCVCARVWQNLPSKSLYNCWSFRSCFPSGGVSFEGTTISREAAISTSKAFGWGVPGIHSCCWCLSTDTDLSWSQRLTGASMRTTCTGSINFSLVEICTLSTVVSGKSSLSSWAPNISSHHSSWFDNVLTTFDQDTQPRRGCGHDADGLMAHLSCMHACTAHHVARA